MDDMKSKYPDKIQKVTIMYGCDFKELLKSEEAKPFTESELFGKQFFSRLRVRDAFATNRQDLYKLSWSEKKFPEEKFHIWDMNSCYTTGQIRGARGSRPFKLVNEIMSLTKVGIYALGVTKIH